MAETPATGPMKREERLTAGRTPAQAARTRTAPTRVASIPRRGYEGVAVAVPVTVPYVRYSTRGAHWFIGQAMAALIAQSGIDKEAIDGLCISSFTLGPDTAVGVAQHLDMTPRWLDHIPMGGASAVVALRRAARAVQAGDASVVAVIGADTNHVDSFRQSLGSFSQFARDATWPYGTGGPNSMFAFITAHYMRQTGATREDFGKLCVAQRSFAVQNPHALLRKPLSMSQYLSARPIAEPLHLFDCVMPCAGADAFLVMSEARARDQGLSYAVIRGAIERHNAYYDDPILVRGGWAMDQAELWAQADAKPSQMDFLQAYDDYPVILMMHLEGLGFCAIGEGPQFVRAHAFDREGSLPLNTSGGQLSVGQAGAAGGHLGLVEAIRQLTDAAGARQLSKARIGAVSGYGMVTYDRCLCTAAAVLARPD
jgi:acetyl-CoA acetyltransferase